VVEFAPGLPDDDVAILAARVMAGVRVASGPSAAPAAGTHSD
jgi:hypothetical protein